MSYLDVPRIHFCGTFFTDPSTVDNDPKHYDVACVNPSPWQDPSGNHLFQFVDCTIRSALDKTGASSADAAVIGARVESTDWPACAKLADLDVYQQGVSSIFGLNVKLALNDGTSLVAPLDTAVLNGALFNVVLPQRGWGQYDEYGWGSYGGDSNARGIFQSVLRVDPGQWPARSPLLKQLRAAAAVVDGQVLLSLKLTLDGYINNPENSKFRTGRIVGCLGPFKANEPLYCPGQRWLSAVPSPDNVTPKPAWFVPAFYDGPFKIDETRKVLVVDLSNSIATASIGGPPVDVGTLSAVIRGPDTVIGDVQFSQFIYENSAGICEWPLNAKLLKSLKSNPLSLVTSRTDIGEPDVLNESASGFNLAIDDRILRIPGDVGTTQSVRVHATQWGKPAVGVKLNVNVVPVHGTTPGATVPPDNPGDTRQAEGAVSASVTATDADGFATVTVEIVSDPGARTPLLDGQLYFIYPYAGAAPVIAQENRISCLAWSHYPVNTNPTWDDVVAMLAVYVKLFPAMTEQINLTDQVAFATYAASPPFAFYGLKDYKVLDRITGGAIPFFLTRDQNDPRFMPVTRDLSPNKIKTLLYYIQNNYFPPTAPPGKSKKKVT